MKLRYGVFIVSIWGKIWVCYNEAMLYYDLYSCVPDSAATSRTQSEPMGTWHPCHQLFISSSSKFGARFTNSFSIKFKYGGNYILLSHLFSQSYHNKILHMTQQLCCLSMRKTLLCCDSQSLNYSKGKFLLHLNYKQKSLVKWASAQNLLLWCENNDQIR